MDWLDFTFLKWFGVNLPSGTIDYLMFGFVVCIGPMLRMLQAKMPNKNKSTKRRYGVSSLFDFYSTVSNGNAPTVVKYAIISTVTLVVGVLWLLALALIFVPAAMLVLFFAILFWAVWPFWLLSFSYAAVFSTDPQGQRDAKRFLVTCVVPCVLFIIVLVINVIALRFVGIHAVSASLCW